MTPAYQIDPRLLEALRDVSDPELPLNVVDMGLIYSVWQQESIVYVKLT
jgi:metal-sulfur cluster biosynthetic enzyme